MFRYGGWWEYLWGNWWWQVHGKNGMATKYLMISKVLCPAMPISWCKTSPSSSEISYALRKHQIMKFCIFENPWGLKGQLWKKCFWRHCIEGDQHFPEKMRDNSDHSLPFLKLVYAVVEIYSRAKLIFALRKTQEAEHRRVIKLPRKKSSLKTWNIFISSFCF